MKKLSKMFAIFLILALVISCLPYSGFVLNAETQAQTPFIYNASFEEGSGTSVTKWTHSGGGTSLYKATITQDTAYDGDSSVVFNSTSKTKNSGITQSVTGLTTTNRYLLSAYAKASTQEKNYTNAGFRIGIQYKDSAGTTKQVWSANAFRDAADWTKISTVFTIPEGATSIKVCIQVNNVMGTYYIDAVSIQDLGEIGSFVDNSFEIFEDGEFPYWTYYEKDTDANYSLLSQTDDGYVGKAAMFTKTNVNYRSYLKQTLDYTVDADKDYIVSMHVKAMSTDTVKWSRKNWGTAQLELSDGTTTLKSAVITDAGQWVKLSIIVKAGDLSAAAKWTLKFDAYGVTGVIYVDNAQIAEYTESVITPTDPADGMAFTADDFNKVDGVFAQTPCTFEATLKFPSDFSAEERGGVIVGNYSGSGNSINFEIFSNGSPRIIYTTSSVTGDYIFENVNVYTGEWIHLAVVCDNAAGVLNCYVNGELTQSIEAVIPNLTYSYVGVVGGDHRAQNSSYFRGLLRSVALYSDVRTQEEIASDMDEIGVDSLIAAWDLTSEVTDGKIADIGENGYDLQITKLWFTDKTPVTDYAYSFVVVGDTQRVNYDSPKKLADIYDWILENKDSKNIQYVLGLGDITDNDADREWTNAYAEISKMNDVVPYSLVRGNHDGTEKFNATFNNEPYINSFAGQYDGNIENTWREFKVGDIDYLVLTLDYNPTDGAVEWAAGVVEAHQNHNVIITTHSYINADGTLTSTGGTAIWENLGNRYENIVLIIGGHIRSDYVVTTTRTGENGNVVTEMLVNPQGVDEEYGATGMITTLYFSEDGSKVTAECYSTVRKQYFMTENQYDFELAVIEPKAECETHEYEYTDNGDGESHKVSCKNCTYSAEELHKYENGICKCKAGVAVGDATEDGVINAVDIVRLKKMIANNAECYTYLDVDGDGFLNALDLMALRNRILNK